MNEYIDLYCERLAPGLLGEPLNALSNVSYFIAAWAIWSLAHSKGKIPTGIWILIVLTIAIGVGSTLFHTFATRWSNIMDVVPILLFQLYFIWLYTQKVIDLKPGFSGIVVAAFYFVSNFSRQFKHVLNGSLAYAPALIVLGVLGLYHNWRSMRERWVLLVATGVFFLSLIFRTVDQISCSSIKTGTHFLWHIFNGLLLYLVARGLILNWPKKLSLSKSTF